VRRVVISIVCLLATAPAALAADVAAPPQWSADQIRAARSASPETSLILDVEQTTSSNGGPPKAARERVTLASSFTFVESATGDVLYDHALCRTLTWRPGGPTFDSVSCYAAVAFRVLESQNRQLLANMLAASKITPSAGLQPVWAEAELAYQSVPSDPLERIGVAGGVEYRLGDVVAVRLRVGPATLSANEMHAFVSYLANRFPLHPQVRRDLLKTTNLPSTIEIGGFLTGRPYQQSISIKVEGRSAAAYPLPAGLQSSTRPAVAAASPREAGLHSALRVFDGDPALAAPSPQALIATMDAKSAEKKSVEALLLFLELAQLDAEFLKAPGNSQLVATSVAPQVRGALGDPATAPLWRANALAGGEKGDDREQAAKYLAFAKLDDFPFGTFRYVTFANLVRGSGDTSKWDPSILKAMPPLVDGLWLHVARYPWGSNAYKDIGDTYLSEYRMTDAWLAYDLGRSLDKDWQSGTMADLGRFEDQMRAQQSDFF
jgi:hypothetical protein